MLVGLYSWVFLASSRVSPAIPADEVEAQPILRAVMRTYAQQPEIEAEAGLAEEEVRELTDIQERYNLVMVHYLAESTSQVRAAELLGISWLDLRTRCLRLDVPLRTAPADLAKARGDVETALRHTPPSS